MKLREKLCVGIEFQVEVIEDIKPSTVSFLAINNFPSQVLWRL